MDRAGLLEVAGRLYVNGVDVDWQKDICDSEARRVVLPAYPFEPHFHPPAAMGQVSPVDETQKPLPASHPKTEPGGDEISELSEEKREKILNDLESGTISYEDAIKKLKDKE